MITSAITIQGNGATLQRDPTLFTDLTDPCSGSGAKFRIVRVGTGGDLTLDDVTVRYGCANRTGGGATSGGGIFNTGGTVTLTNATVAQNTADLGGGIFNDDTATITNTLLAQNAASFGANCDGALVSQGHNLATDTSCNLMATGDQQGVTDPGLGPFTDLGLPGTGHFPLLPTSSAIDMGDDTKCPNTDQLGLPRADGNGDNTITCDIGAIEFQTCGDGDLDAGEECDDGNTLDGDGCSALCHLENQPPVAQCTDATVSTDPGVCTAAASIDNGSFDPDGNLASLSQSPPDPYSLGMTGVTLIATDSFGLMASCSATVAVVDNEAPQITCPADQAVTATGPGGTAVSFAVPTPTDNCPGLLTASCSPPSGSAFPIGSTPVTCTTTDAASNQNSCSFAVTVTYPFSNFLAPVDAFPTFNAVTAGQGVPVRFSLGDDYGLNIFATGYPKSQSIACPLRMATDTIEETVTAGASGLTYDLSTDQYTYVWKTNKAWAGTCRQLLLKFNDGMMYPANFQFK